MIFNEPDCRSHLRGFVAASLGLIGLLFGTSASAAFLNFPTNICENIGTCTDGSFISDTYGDVPNALEVSFRNLQGEPTLSKLRYWNSGYGDLQGVAWTGRSDAISRAEIFLKPLNGRVVTLSAFDLAAFNNVPKESQFTILDGDFNILFESGELLIPAQLHSHFTFTGLTTTNGIRIQWGPSAFNVAIDNINFTASFVGQPVPLPPAAALFVGGLALLARRRNRV